MMNALLGSVSYAAMSAGGALPDFEDQSFTLNEALKHSSYTISNSGKTLTNVSGGDDYRHWVPTIQTIPELNQIFYWEVQCLDSGPTTYNGYLGVASKSQHDSPTLGPLTVNSPISLGSIGYRGNGTIWGIDTTQQASGFPTYGINDTIMFAFNPITKQFWLGKNGVWHRNPETEAASYVANTSNQIWYPYVQGRNTASGGTIKTVPADFLYPVPASAIALGRTLLTYDITIDYAQSFSVLGTRLTTPE